MLALSEQDMALLMALHDYTYLDKKYIKQYIYTTHRHGTSVDNRLTRLAKHNYITAFSAQIDTKKLKVSHVYTLGKVGAEILEAEKGVIHWKPSWAKSLRPMWRHQLMIAEVVKQFELKAEAAGLELKEFIPEPRAFYQFDGADAGKKTNVVRPDGIIVVGKKGAPVNVGIMVEMERSYSDREYTLRKVRQYNRFFSNISEHGPAYDRHVAFSEPVADWRVLFIGGTDGKTERLLRDLHGEMHHVKTLVAEKEALEKDPFGTVYRDTDNPDEYGRL